MRRILATTPVLLALLACAPAPEADDDATPAAADAPVLEPSDTAALAARDTLGGAAPSQVPAGSDPWQAARARGADFRAIGQEPGWHLELEEEREIRFVLQSGERHVFSPVPAPSRGIESPSLFYAVRSDGKTLNLIIERTACEDIMSGERFPATVTVELDGETYRGCGRDLGDG